MVLTEKLTKKIFCSSYKICCHTLQKANVGSALSNFLIIFYRVPEGKQVYFSISAEIKAQDQLKQSEWVFIFNSKVPNLAISKLWGMQSNASDKSVRALAKILLC